jgi:hypothetical protein
MRFSIVLLAVFLFANIATACKCAPAPSVLLSYDAATTVFMGKVQSIQEVKYQRVVTLRIIEAFKGAQVKTITLHTGSGGGDCGFPFVLNRSYLVYASGTLNDLGTNICSRTKGVAKASPELGELRKLRGPVSED